MGIKITVDMFSGRPNPTVVLGELESRELLARLKQKKGKRGKAQGVPPVLGYRGIDVDLGKPKQGLPATFRIARGVIETGDLAHTPVDPSVEDFICGSTGLRQHLPGPQLDELRIGIERLRRYPWPFRPIKPFKLLCACAPLYEPSWWNDGGQIQYNNNCYNYSTNYRSDTFAQPGLATGNMYGSITGPEVLAGAVSDCLIDKPSANNKCPKEGHLVALVIAPGYDFHWYRKGRSGRWSHKPGGTQATNHDNSGVVITDPRTADRGPYTEFTTFMVVMHGHILLQ